MRILFVCTGNLCRSPMAEAMLRHELARRRVAGVSVGSAGTWAGTGNRATEDAVRTLQARGIDLSRHTSRPLERAEIDDADLVVVMTSVHEREVLALVPEARDKLVLLKELAELEPSLEGGEDATARLKALLATPRPERRRALDVDDPMGLPASSYERCAHDLDAGIRVLADALAGGSPAAGRGR